MIDKKILRKKVNCMMTDLNKTGPNVPANPDHCSVFTVHYLFTEDAELADISTKCQAGTIGCGTCKSLLYNNILKKDL